MKNSLLILFFIVVTISGCVVKNAPPVAVYTISPEWGAGQEKENSAPACNCTLKLAPIRSDRSFISTDMVYMDSAFRQKNYTLSRWNDAPVRMLQTVLQVAIERSGIFRAVVPYTSSAETDFILECMLYDFSHHINEDGSSDGVLRASFNLVERKDGRVVAAREFYARAPSSSINAQGGAEALNRAARELATGLVEWLAGSDLSGK